MTSTDASTPLRRVREARGLRLEDLASASGVAIRTVFDAERGPRPPARVE
jgi:transcriptional regulator with XRE-family HTH domain